MAAKARSLVTADTSVVVPALTSWHEFHKPARSAVSGIDRLPAHVVLESVAVLTRLPGGRAISASAAVSVLRSKFPGDLLAVTPAGYDGLVDALAASGIRGGQVYDALVGSTAREAGAVLLTRDARARPTYLAVGANIRLVDD